MRSTVITDASFDRVGSRGYGGWAAWVRLDHLPKPIKKSGAFTKYPVHNSLQAEVLACVNGIAVALHYGASDILLQTDCVAVVSVINKKAKPTAKALPLVNHALGMINLTGVRLKARHVKGHTKNPDARSYVNRWCDAEAKKHMRRLRDGGG
jgi:ribonuclease HI